MRGWRWWKVSRGDGGARTLVAFTATVELVEGAGHAHVISRVGGFSFVVGDLPETFPYRGRVVG